MSTSRIFILSHRNIPDIFPKRDCYSYVKCGGPVSDSFDLDDFAGGIQDLNWCFCEATAIVSIVKMPSIYQDFEYIGFGQYRRYLDFSDDQLVPGAILCSPYDVKRPVIDQYLICHYPDTVNMFMQLMNKVDPRLVQAIHEYFCFSNILYRANCFIAHIDIFKQYCEFIKYILPVMEKITRDKIIDISEYDPYQKRYMSFLFERLTSFWIHYMKQSGIKIQNVKLVDLDIKNTVNGTR